MAIVDLKNPAGGTFKVELTSAEPAVVRKAIEVYTATRIRMRAKEVAGSEMHSILSREIVGLQELMDKFF